MTNANPHFQLYSALSSLDLTDLVDSFFCKNTKKKSIWKSGNQNWPATRSLLGKIVPKLAENPSFLLTFGGKTCDKEYD